MDLVPAGAPAFRPAVRAISIGLLRDPDDPVDHNAKAYELVAITFICYRFMGLPDLLLTRSSQALAACDR
jgi:hypothetical protein